MKKNKINYNYRQTLLPYTFYSLMYGFISEGISASGAGDSTGDGCKAGWYG
jgi:hypothetical protein